MKYTFVHRMNRERGGRKGIVRFPFTIHTVEAFNGFQRAGYIQICHIPDAPWLNQPYWWLSTIRNVFYSSRVICTMDDVFALTRTNLNSAAWSMHVACANDKDANNMQSEFLELSKNQAATHMVNVLIPMFMKLRQNRLSFMWDRRYHNECGMYTDFIRVEEPYRGSGLAEQLYYRAGS